MTGKTNTTIKSAAVISSAAYLLYSKTILLSLGDAILLGLCLYAFLFYTIEGVIAFRAAKAFKQKLAGIIRLPILHTEPLALLIAAVPSLYFSYRSAAPHPGVRVVLAGMLLCYFFMIFLLANSFLNIIKYWNKDRLYADEVRTAGLGDTLYPLAADHLVKTSFILALPPATLVFLGLFIIEESLGVNVLKKHADMFVLMLVFVPSCIWLLLRMLRQIQPPVSVNFPRMVVVSINDLRRASQVKTWEDFLAVTEKRKIMFGVWEKIHSFQPRLHREMAVNYLYLKNYDLAIDYFGKYLEGFRPKRLKTDRQLEMVPFLSTGVNKILFKKYRSFFEPEIHTLDENFGHLEYLRPHKVLESFENIKKKTSGPELNFVYARFLKMLVDRYDDYSQLLAAKEKERFTAEDVAARNSSQWEEAILKILARPEEYRQEPLGESLNVVFVISNKNYFRDAFVLKGQPNRGNLEKEWRNTELIGKASKNFPGFLAPEPLHLLEQAVPHRNDRIFVYVMQRHKGINALEFIRENRRTDILDDVARFLALIHASMPNNGFTTDHWAKVKNKFNEIGRGENNTAQTIVAAMTPVAASLKESVLVFGKDAHPENWWMTENGAIVALDNEDKGAVPMEIDLVNLLEYDDFGLPREEREGLKEHVIGEYLKFYTEYNNGAGAEHFSRLRYLNAVIQRALCWYCFWSCPGREALRWRRPHVLGNALFAIKEINSRYNGYYSSHQEDYQNLERGIKQIYAEVNNEK